MTMTEGCQQQLPQYPEQQPQDANPQDDSNFRPQWRGTQDNERYLLEPMLDQEMDADDGEYDFHV